MDNYEKERKIEKIREAFAHGKVFSVEFYSDGSGATFYYMDPNGNHGTPCDMASSFDMKTAIQIVSGFRLKPHEIRACC